MVVVYCTGGVRCEKFSGWMVREGYKDVNNCTEELQLMVKDPEVQGELWDGKMYVFDERIAVDVNHVNPTIVGERLVLMEHHVNVMSTVEIHSVIVVS